jgi:lysozyme
MSGPTKISDAGLRMLQGFEGFREHAYKDVVGVWTVGYGETQLDGRAVREGDHVNQKDGLALLRVRCDGHFGMAVRATLGAVVCATLEQHQFDALVSLTYNIGAGAFRTSTVARKLIAGDTAGAGAAFLMWTKGGGRVLPVLVRRRADERRCFDHAEYPK